jgi:hypothetical protein
MVRTNEVSIAMLSIVLFFFVFFTWMASIRIVRFFFCCCVTGTYHLLSGVKEVMYQ